MRCDKLGFGETKGKKVYMLNWIRSSREGLTKLNDKFWNFFSILPVVAPYEYDVVVSLSINRF